MLLVSRTIQAPDGRSQAVSHLNWESTVRLGHMVRSQSLCAILSSATSPGLPALPSVPFRPVDKVTCSWERQSVKDMGKMLRRRQSQDPFISSIV